MSVAKVVEVTSTSSKNFEDAIQAGIKRASKTIDNIQGAWVNELKADVNKSGKVSAYRVNLKIPFVLKG